MGSILIRGAKLADPEKMCCERLDLLCRNGVIEKIEKNIQDPADKTVDAQSLVLLPGLVDMHVHLRDPGLTYKEDVFTGCRAAAAGGVTSLLAMPNTKPPMDSPALVEELLQRAESACCRVYPAVCITKGMKGEELAPFMELQKAGAVALTDDGRPVENSLLMARAMKEAASLGLRVVSHCEDLYLSQGGLMNEGAVSRELNVPGVPEASENAATAREIALAESYGVPIHICHVSTAVSAAMIRDAKKRGVQVTGETAPHYLLLTEEALRKKNADWRMSPPLRTDADRKALLEALRDGTLDAIATDHAPHSEEDKADFYRAPNGSIGMETALSACYTALVKPGYLTLPELIAKMSLNPARLLKLPGGTLRAGGPADFALFDESRRWTVDRDRLHGRSKNTPFHGMSLSGKVVMTVCRGEIVYQHG